MKTEDAKLTFAQAAAFHMNRVEKNVRLKRRTRQYWKQTLAAFQKGWPELAETQVKRITNALCRDWAARYAKTAGPTHYNNSLDLLRHIVEIAVEKGVIYSNPATGLERKPVRPKQVELPTLAEFDSFVAEMRSAHSRDSQNCADFVQGLAFTGCRISEAARIEWRDLNFSAGEILVKDDPEEATKNGEVRRVPMIPNARELFTLMREARSDERPEANVFRVRESQKSMNGAAEKTGMTRIAHHDLRHFFTTVCIESGVDIPTVSRWLGHKDGGALAMRTYGHLRREHSVAQAQKVSFSPVLPPPLNPSAPSDEPSQHHGQRATKTTSSSRKPRSGSWTVSLDGERVKKTVKPPAERG